MKLVQLGKNNLDEIAEEAAKIIASGGVVIAPFDTVYGIFCDAENKEAVLKLFEIKNRPLEQPIGTAVSDFEMMQKTAVLDEEQKQFIKSRVPGKYTFIVNSAATDITKYCKKRDTIGIRIPDSKLILEIIKKSDRVIAQTSANLSGMENCYSANEVISQYEDNFDSIDLIIDGGEIRKEGASEIIDLTGKSPTSIERKR